MCVCISVCLLCICMYPFLCIKKNLAFNDFCLCGYFCTFGSCQWRDANSAMVKPKRKQWNPFLSLIQTHSVNLCSDFSPSVLCFSTRTVGSDRQRSGAAGREHFKLEHFWKSAVLPQSHHVSTNRFKAGDVVDSVVEVSGKKQEDTWTIKRWGGLRWGLLLSTTLRSLNASSSVSSE